MKFVCDRCQTRYSIADEKVRQKILRIRCKTCSTVIVVQGEQGVASVAAAGESALVSRAVAGGAKSLPRPVPTPNVATASSLKSVPASASSPAPAVGKPALPAPRPPAVAAFRRTSVPPPPPVPGQSSDALGGRIEWYVAVAGVRSGPFSRADACRRILAADSAQVVHVWKDGMSGWKQAEEVSVIARELSLSRTPPPPPPVAPQTSRAPTPPPLATSAKATPASLFPGKPLDDVLADGTTERMDMIDSPDPSSFAELTTKKGNGIGKLADVAVKGDSPETTAKKAVKRTKQQDEPIFSEITTKKSKNLRDLESQPVVSKPAANDVASPSAEDSSEAPLVAAATSAAGTPASLTSATSATIPVTASAELGALAEVMRAVADPEAVQTEPQVFPEAQARSSPLDVSASETKKPRPGLKYVLAAGVIVGLVLLITLVSFRMDSRKVPVEPEMPQTKAASEPTVAVAADPKPVPAEPEAVIPAVDERPAFVAHGNGRRTMVKTVRQVGPAPAPIPSPAGATAERPVPKLAGGKGADARPNPFDETRTVSQAQISAVVRSKTNQSGLKSCYERALKMDNHLTSGRIDVTVSIGMSGMVQRVVVNAPPAFILVEPCIKNAVKRWVFPPSSEEYATNFPLIMQGGL